MGGHGGLNILPQKKWNVYNWDNRLIVERDKRLAKEREQAQERQDHNDEASYRVQKLKKLKDCRSHTPTPEASREPTPEKISNINADLKRMQVEKKHLNLFEREEQDLLARENIRAHIEMEKEFFKDKPYDLSSKFLGQMANNDPWYQKQEPKSDQVTQQRIKGQLAHFRKQNDSYYQVLEFDQKPKEVKQEVKQEIEPQSQEIIDEKKMKKLQKLARKLKEMLGSDSESEDNRRRERLKIRESLKIERMQREKVEREKEKKLIQTKYN